MVDDEPIAGLLVMPSSGDLPWAHHQPHGMPNDNRCAVSGHNRHPPAQPFERPEVQYARSHIRWRHPRAGRQHHQSSGFLWSVASTSPFDFLPSDAHSLRLVSVHMRFAAMLSLREPARIPPCPPPPPPPPLLPSSGACLMVIIGIDRMYGCCIQPPASL